MELQRTKVLTHAVIQYGHLRMDRSILEDVIDKFYKLGSIRNTCIIDVFDNKMGQRKDPQRTPDNTSITAAKKPRLAAHHGLHSTTKVPFLSSSEYRD